MATTISEVRSEEGLRGLLGQNLKRIQAALGPGEDISAKICAAMLSEATRVPKLLECTPASLIDCVLKASQLRLPFGGVLGFCYMIPFKNRGTLEAQFVIGYKGMMQMARRSREIVDIRATCVYEGDDFDLEYGLHPRLHHVPKFATDDPAKVSHVYVACRLTTLRPGDDPVWDCWTRAEIEAHKKRYCKSASREDSAWNTDWPAMAAKTIIRRMCSRGRIPMSTDDHRAVVESEDLLRRIAAASGGGNASQAMGAGMTAAALAGAISGNRATPADEQPETPPHLTTVLADVRAAESEEQLEAIRERCAQLSDDDFGQVMTAIMGRSKELHGA